MRLAGKTLLIMACSVAVFHLTACADKAVRTVENSRKPLGERLSETGGYKQDSDGSWVPKSDRRSSFDGQRDSPFFSKKIQKEEYKTGDYAKKSWWGGKEDFKKSSYTGDTGTSRFQQQTAEQQGRVSKDSAQDAGLSQSYDTNTLDRKGAREAQAAAIGRSDSSYVESNRDGFPTPSVFGYKEQRDMSVGESRGLLGR